MKNESLRGNIKETDEENSLDEKQRKKFAEKVEKGGYYKKEDGIWWKAYDDGFDEQVEWFRLDEEYPDLADKTEKLAEKYHVMYDDNSRLKEYIWKHADELKDADDEHLARIFRIAGAITFNETITEELLVGYSADKLELICKTLDEYYGGVAELMPDKKLDRRIMQIGECLVQNYNRGLMEGDFLEKLIKYSAKAFLDKQREYALMSGIKNAINGISKNESSGALFGDYMAYYDSLIDDNEKITKWDTKRDVLGKYVQTHGLSDKTIDGFKTVIFPLMEQRDDEIKPIIEGGNAYGITVGTYGIADYTEECLLSSYSPREIDKLIRIYHEIPTSDYRKFEQNRKDAARLQDTIIGGRDFIHDERPGVNEVLVAMRDFYEHHNDEDADKYRARLEELEEKYHFHVLPNAFKIEAYEKPVPANSDGYLGEDGSPEDTALDILNRLIENTKPDVLKAPVTDDPELNELMMKIAPIANERTGEVHVDFNAVSEAVARMNALILQNKNKQGIRPSIIAAIAFLDKMSAYALRGLERKDLEELPFDSGFKEMVRFSQLTSSTEYDEKSFEDEYRQMVDKISEAYGEDYVNSQNVTEAYRILHQMIIHNMQSLSRYYEQKKNTARFSEALWSGNLSDELIGLFERV